MIFTEPRFLLFFAVVFTAYWALDSRRAQKVLLLAASYTFYAAWDWRFLSLILASTLIDYTAALRIEAQGERPERDGRRRAWLLLSLAANLGMLGFFKYFGFFVDSALELGAAAGVDLRRPTLEIVLPVGISFYTFQTMSYTIDVYRRVLAPRRSLLDVALFVAFFPQLVAGPIVRAREFLPQLGSRVPFASIAVRPLLLLFLAGFVKKACISDNVATVVDPFFADPAAFTAASAWLAIVLYSVQIYCDFSGYSDMAIATAGLLGLDLGRNFDFPYLARSVREFWQRWHISLSTWLRDYLYIPLGGNRGRWLRTVRNLFLTMTLGGLWHGAAWRFVLWGALHGAGLAAHREVHRALDRRRPLLGVAPAILLTFVWTTLLWIFFRATDLDSAFTIFESVLLLSSPGSIEIAPVWWGLFAALAAVHVLAYLGLGRRLAELPAWAFGAAYGAAAALTLLFVRIEARPFIYFQF
ncbi:MAG TPA: MBOAT family protein [Thermoanaerobaculia bacterium]|nr:MBOAT family protein [Thermoanaerobaculia bacterium]